MKRRDALLALCATLAGCGGGGSDTAPSSETPQPTHSEPAAPTQAAPVQAKAVDIAAWGDSLTVQYVPLLASTYPERSVYNGGVGGQTSSQILARMKADAGGRNAWITVLWMGRNNFQDANQVRADIDAAVKNLAPGNDKFVVLSVLNGSYGAWESKGGGGYSQIVQLNASLSSIYAGHYLDVRSHLISQYDPSKPQDMIDFANDVVPMSLRTDAIHLNAKGCQIVVSYVRDFIEGTRS